MDPLQELKETCEKLGTAFNEFKAEHTKSIKDEVNKVLVEAKLDKLGQTLDDLTGKKEDLEKRIKLEREEREALERKVNLLRAGPSKSDDFEQKALKDFNIEVKAVAKTRGLPQPPERRDRRFPRLQVVVRVDDAQGRQGTHGRGIQDVAGRR